MEAIPCPFCKKKVSISVNANTFAAQVRCKNCGLTMKKNYKGHKCIGDIMKILITEDWNKGAEP